MKTTSGRTLPTVTIELMIAASRMPRRIRTWYIHMTIEATPMASAVLPLPNPGRKTPSEAMSSTR